MRRLGGRLGLLLCTLAWLLAAPDSPSLAQAPLRVGVLVQFADERVETYCVALDAPTPTGYDALLASGQPLEASVSAQGIAICRIGETGCPANDCFCQCRGADCNYWAYFALADGVWQTATVGAGGRAVRHGDVEGWRWGSGAPPPVMTFEQICGEAAAPATQAPVADQAAAEETPSTDRTPTWIAVAAAVGAAALALILSRRKKD